MKRKLIEVSQEHIIVCDNPNCTYVIENKTKTPFTDTLKYVNMPCPVCGENLLTEKDYLDGQRVAAAINWINKWFSWIMLFVPKNAKEHTGNIKVHNGITFTKYQKSNCN